MHKYFVIFFLWLSSQALAENLISDIRIWQAPDSSQIVLDMSQAADYQLDYSEVKSQLQLKLLNTNTINVLDRKLNNDKRLSRIRTKQNAKQLIVAFDLKKPIRPKSFVALPNDKYSYRLIIELKDIKPETEPVKIIKNKEFLVAIDAGHGGEDSGAIGVNNYKEKSVVLAIAEELKEYINTDPEMQAFLLRKGDYYLSLKNRVRMAEEAKADLFISIHADAYRDKGAKGASVYILSKTGASSSMADWLADKENSADKFGGTPIEEGSNSLLEGVLSDLISSAKNKDSKQAAGLVLNSLKRSKLIDIHSRQVERANFFVLRNGSIPAILVETGFMSNPEEAELLADADYRKQIALIIYRALVEYKKFN